MVDCSSTIDPDVLAGQMGDLPRATDRLRLVGLDHVARVQQARVGASERRLALVQARRPNEGEEIARAQTALAVETHAQRSYGLAVGTAEIDAPRRTPGTAVIHGRVIAADGTPAAGLTVAAVEPSGSIRRYTCTDTRGYFLMSLPLGDQRPVVVFLQVSDAGQAVLYRGDEAITLADQAVTYRLIQLGTTRRDPCPQPPERTLMPDLLGQPEASAMAMLGRLGLKVGQRLTQRDPERAGLVVSQTPAAGEPIDQNTSVTLVIGNADPADTIAVPDVVGLRRDEAQEKLKEAGLAVGEFSTRPGNEPGLILSQDPVAGVRVAPGTAVSLVIAAQAPPDDRVAAPDLVGQKLEVADRLLDDAGLVRGQVELREDDRAGLVLDQKPPAQTPVPKGSAIDLVVGRQAETEQATVPDLVGSTLSNAREILARSRLQLGEVTGPANGRVTEQKPASGSTVPVGSMVAVTLVVASRNTFGGRLATAVTGDPGFAALGLDARAVHARLITAANSPDTAKSLAALPETELQARFEIKNRKQARDFRRMLNDGLKGL